MAARMNAVVVGCGWAGALHAEAYHDHPQIELAAVCDPDLKKARILAARLGCRAYDSLEALLESETIHIASLASPTETHVELGKMLLAAGLPFLCEKPLARDSASARELVKVAETRNLPLGVNYNRRFASGYQIARQHLDGAGRVHFITCILAQNVPLAQTPELRASLSEDTLIFDALSHQVDLVRFLVGEPQRVVALGSREVPNQLWTDIQVGLLFENGALGSLVCSLSGPEWGQLPIERTEIATQKERIVVDNITARVDWFNYWDQTRHTWMPGIFEPTGYQESLRASVRAWVEAVIAGKPAPIDAENGVRAVEICEQVRQTILAQEEGMRL